MCRRLKSATYSPDADLLLIATSEQDGSLPTNDERCLSVRKGLQFLRHQYLDLHVWRKQLSSITFENKAIGSAECSARDYDDTNEFRRFLNDLKLNHTIEFSRQMV